MTDADTYLLSRTRAEALHAADPLAGYRDRFVRDAADLRYLDGNSLGQLPKSTMEVVTAAMVAEWGGGLVRSWDRWIDLPGRVGDLIGTRLLGARPGEVVVCDSTTVNLYKLAAAALAARPGRRTIVTAADEFPTDLYVLEGLAAAGDHRLRRIPANLDGGPVVEDVVAAMDADVALVALSHVGYRSGALADLPAITAAAQAAGALMLWDLSHSAGAVPVDLAAANADLAVGCSYKYLNGGPGAPAYLYVRSDLQPALRQPIWGWFGQRDQFAMGAEYEPLPGIGRYTVGTPPVLALYAVQEGVRLLAEAGIAALHAKGMAMTAYLIELADAWLEPLGFRLASPRDPARRGAHVSLRHPRAWQVCQALADRDVVPDFRPPDVLRLGPAPLTTSYVDVYEALARLRALVRAGEHLDYPATPGRVT